MELLSLAEGCELHSGRRAMGSKGRTVPMLSEGAGLGEHGKLSPNGQSSMQSGLRAAQEHGQVGSLATPFSCLRAGT